MRIKTFPSEKLKQLKAEESLRWGEFEELPKKSQMKLKKSSEKRKRSLRRNEAHQKEVVLDHQLAVLMKVGLVGKPNAGKSTFFTAITSATAQIGG